MNCSVKKKGVPTKSKQSNIPFLVETCGPQQDIETCTHKHTHINYYAVIMLTYIANKEKQTPKSSTNTVCTTNTMKPAHLMQIFGS